MKTKLLMFTIILLLFLFYCTEINGFEVYFENAGFLEIPEEMKPVVLPEGQKVWEAKDNSEFAILRFYKVENWPFGQIGNLDQDQKNLFKLMCEYDVGNLVEKENFKIKNHTIDFIYLNNKFHSFYIFLELEDQRKMATYVIEKNPNNLVTLQLFWKNIKWENLFNNMIHKSKF